MITNDHSPQSRGAKKCNKRKRVGVGALVSGRVVLYDEDDLFDDMYTLGDVIAVSRSSGNSDGVCDGHRTIFRRRFNPV